MAGRGDNDFGGGGDGRGKGGTNNSGEDHEETPAERRASEYVRSLLGEKLAIDQGKLPIASKLLDQEVTRAQAEGKGPGRNQKFADIYRERPIKVAVKVLVPLKEHPKFNFVGKLLGPKGNSLKRLQEETMCRMAILGRGSMRDRDKEEEMRKSLEPKYSHLTDELHVEISALGPPAEAYARIAFALTEIRKYLIPDATDDISQNQLREMETIEDHPKGPRGPPGGGPFRHPGMRAPPSRPPMAMRTATRQPVAGPRGMGGKSNVMSILDRARASMEDNYGGGYEEPYEPEPPFNDYSPSGPNRSGYGGGGGNRFGGGGGGNSNYESDYYGEDSNNYGGGGGENQRWKPYKPGGAAARPDQPRYRPTPYSRAGK